MFIYFFVWPKLYFGVVGAGAAARLVPKRGSQSPAPAAGTTLVAVLAGSWPPGNHLGLALRGGLGREVTEVPLGVTSAEVGDVLAWFRQPAHGRDAAPFPCSLRPLCETPAGTERQDLAQWHFAFFLCLQIGSGKNCFQNACMKGLSHWPLTHAPAPA